MRNSFFILLICCGIVSRAQDSAYKPWSYLVDNYKQQEPLLKRTMGEPEKNAVTEEKMLILQKNKVLIEKQLEQELIRRKDPAALYHIRGGNFEYDFSYETYIVNIIDSLLNAMLLRDAEGRIKNKQPQTTFTLAEPCNNCMQSPFISTLSDTVITIFEWKKPPVRKIHQKTKTDLPDKKKETIQKQLSEITTAVGFPLICGDAKTENLKSKLKGNWCNHFYKDGSGKEFWKLFPSAGLMSGCTGIGFFENDSCKEYISGMLSFFGNLPRRKTNFYLKNDALTFTIKTNEGKIEFERYKIIKADENEILLEKINDEIKTTVPFLMIEPGHCGNGRMGDCGKPN